MFSNCLLELSGYSLDNNDNIGGSARFGYQKVISITGLSQHTVQDNFEFHRISLKSINKILLQMTFDWV